jgi:hypothetical protein
VLYSTVLHCKMLFCILHGTALHYTKPHFTILYSTPLSSTILCYTIPFCTILFYFTLYHNFFCTISAVSLRSTEQSMNVKKIRLTEKWDQLDSTDQKISSLGPDLTFRSRKEHDQREIDSTIRMML